MYAHVDSVNIFELIDEILQKPRNNPVHQFDKYQEIEEWLRNQWAGLFRDLLSRMSEREQLTSLATQVAQLGESNKTLRRYLEEVVSSVSPNTSKNLIDEESRRLKESITLAELGSNRFVRAVLPEVRIDVSELRDIIAAANNIDQIVERITPELSEDMRERINKALSSKHIGFANDINNAREIIGLKPLKWRK